MAAALSAGPSLLSVRFTPRLVCIFSPGGNYHHDHRRASRIGRARSHRVRRKKKKKKGRRALALSSPEFGLAPRYQVAGPRYRYFCFRIHARGLAHLFKTYRSTSRTLPLAATPISCPMVHFRARSPPFQIEHDDDGGGGA